MTTEIKTSTAAWEKAMKVIKATAAKKKEMAKVVAEAQKAYKAYVKGEYAKLRKDALDEFEVTKKALAKERKEAKAKKLEAKKAKKEAEVEAVKEIVKKAKTKKAKAEKPMTKAEAKAKANEDGFYIADEEDEAVEKALAEFGLAQ